MSAKSQLHDQLDQLAEDFAARLRRGESATVEEYATSHPELADEIRELFPAIAEIEEIVPRHPKVSPKAALGPAQQPERFGEFRIIREIGRGGMGIVYEAEQESLGRHVALKILPPTGAQNDTHRERFLREAQSAARLHHTNIVPVFAVGEESGIPYFAMQHIRGRGLDDVLRALRQRTDGDAQAQPPDEMTSRLADQLLSGSFDAAVDFSAHVSALPNADPKVETVSSVRADTDAIAAASPSNPAEPLSGIRRQSYFRAVARIGIQVADALAYAHCQGILHRDVKPSNLHLDTHGTAWVMDFGLAKAEGLADLTETGNVVGTLRYLPPERFHGRVDERSDLYSLGLTLYELLALRPAFDAVERAALVQQTMRAQCTPLRQLNSAVPRDLETICLKCLSKESAKRYASGDALAEDLRAFLEGRPIQARRVGPLERAWLRAKRRPAQTVALLFALMTLLALTAFSVGWHFNIRLQERNRLLSNSEQDLKQAVVRETEATTRAQAQTERAEIADELKRRALSINRVTLAHRAWEDNDVITARRELEQCPEDLRYWEWHHLNQKFHSELLVLRTDKENPNRRPFKLAFSPDGLHLACSTTDGAIVTYDLQSKAEKLIGKTRQGSALNVAFSPDGRWLAARVVPDEIRLWEWRKPQVPAPIVIKAGTRFRTANEFVFSPDSSRIYLPVTDNNRAQVIKVFEVATATVVATWQTGTREHLGNPAISPDGKLLAVVEGQFGRLRAVQRWNCQTGQMVQTLSTEGAQRPRELAFTADGKQLVLVAEEMLFRWSSTGKRISSRPAPFYNNRPAYGQIAAVSPDGQGIADVPPGNVIRHTGRPAYALLRGHSQALTCLAFSPDGTKIASSSHDRTIRVWDIGRYAPFRPKVADAKRYHFLPNSRLVAVRAQAPPGKKLSEFPPGVWDADTGEALITFDPKTQLAQILLSEDGRYAVTMTKPQLVRKDNEERSHLRVVVWEIESAKPLHTFDVEAMERVRPVLRPAGTQLTVVLFPNPPRPGKEVPSRQIDWTQVAKSRPAPIWLPVASTKTIFTGDRTVKAQFDGSEVNVWDLTTGQLRFTVRSGGNDYGAIAFSPDGERLATFREGGALSLWDVATGALTFQTKTRHTEFSSLTFSPDGRRLMATNPSLQIWEAPRPLER